jgi:hypothetical protein
VYSFELQVGDRIKLDSYSTHVIGVAQNKKKVIIHLSNGKTLKVGRDESFEKIEL